MEHGKIISGDFMKKKIFFVDGEAMGILGFWSNKIILKSDVVAYQIAKNQSNDLVTAVVMLYKYKGIKYCSFIAVNKIGLDSFEEFIQDMQEKERNDLLSHFGLC